MRQMRFIQRSGHSVLAPDYSRQLVPDQVYDLDERLPHGGCLAEVVDFAWFAPLVPPPPAVPAMPVKPLANVAPPLPAKFQKRTATPLAPATPKE